MAQSAILIGIKGSVIALDRTTGQQLWLTQLKGGDFVNVLVDGDRVIATMRGEAFCLDAASSSAVTGATSG